MQKFLMISGLILTLFVTIDSQIYVGTNPDDADVIDDSTVQDDWTEQDASGKNQFLGGDHELINWSSFITFYIWTDDEDTKVKIDALVQNEESEFSVLVSDSHIKSEKQSSLELELENNEINSFNVYFDCPLAEQGPYQIQISINDDLIFHFQKLCVNGNRNDMCIIIDTDEGEAEVMNDGELENEFDFEHPTYEISGLEDSYSTIEFTVENGVQLIKQIKAWTNSDVEVEIKGETKGVIDQEDELSVNVFYDCGQFKGTTKVSLEIQIPPFDPVSFSWLKKCGSSYKGLYIGNTIGTANIYNKGQIINNLVKYTPKQTQAHFFLWSDIRLIFDQPILSYDSTFMRPDIILEQPGFTHISSNIAQKVSIKFNCIAKGSMNLIFTIPLEQGGVVDFPIYKECEKPKIIKDTSAMTANKLVFLMGIIIVLIALFTLKAGIKKLGNFNNH